MNRQDIRPEWGAIPGNPVKIVCAVSWSAGQRRLDRAHIRAGIERLARKEYGATVRFSQHRLRFPCSWRGVGISAARERVVAPVDRSRRDEIPPDAVRRQIENLGERGEPHLDELGLGE